MVGEAAARAIVDRGRSVIGAVRETASYLADLLKFVCNIAMLAPLAMSVGCEGKSDAKVAPAPAKVIEAAVPIVEEAPPKDAGPIGEFDITFYYVTSEEEVAARIAKQAKAANDNASADVESNGAEGELAAVTPEEPAPREMVPLYETKTCAILAEVDKEFAKALALQGTGRLKDGRLLNVGGGQNCECDRRPCFHVIENQTWGRAGTGQPLQPFRTVAVDPAVIKLGSLLYVPLLDGRTMPGKAPWGGFKHDGCVVADDTGGGIKGKQLDLFVGQKGYFLGLSGSGGSHAWARHVEVFEGASRCERKGRRIGRKPAAI